ncbi:hypothetical protein IMAU10382_01547 [Lactiplantibacillus plantarum]|nr:hypothetical protein [Lactiplantibacillus plantarum]
MALYETLTLTLYFFSNFGITDFMYDLYEGSAETFNVLSIFELLDEDLLLPQPTSVSAKPVARTPIPNFFQVLIVLPPCEVS